MLYVIKDLRREKEKSMFYLTQYINPLSFQYIISIKIINEIFDILGFVFGTMISELSVVYT